MPGTKNYLEEVMAFIHEHRSNESNFEKLVQKLEDECRSEKNPSATGVDKYINNLIEIKEKGAAAYQQLKEKGGSAWPQFEKFVSQFEKAVTEALRET